MSRIFDELRREALVSNDTWLTLSTYYDKKQMVDIVVTVGGSAMAGLATNSFSVQVEPGHPAMPND